jgi:23S rRNA U2552 (ribose-2'-O)-methylase RlmE/FtsJ
MSHASASALPLQLIQIQKQHKIITPGAAVLDLGCAPGAWLQVACQNLGPLEKGGLVVGVDVKVSRCRPGLQDVVVGRCDLCKGVVV